MRIGYGYDVHRLVPGRKLIIGGEEISYTKGLLGHSDADVLLHAVCDALLGAAALGDIGRHFPDTDDKYKDISSISLLKAVSSVLSKNGFKVVNVDAVVVAQAPRFSPYTEKMSLNIASALGIARQNVNVKATTEEGLGFTGNGEGIAAHAVCLIEEVS